MEVVMAIPAFVIGGAMLGMLAFAALLWAYVNDAPTGL